MNTFSVSLVAGYQFPTDGSVDVTYALMNLLAKPTINLEGSIGSATIADGAVTTAKLADNVLAASTTGRGKMEDGFFSADSTGRAKIAAGFFGAADATSLAIFADSFLTAAKLADTATPTLIAAVRNLVATNASNSTVTITADEVILKTSGGKPFVASSVSLTLDITASGANGLDTGSEGSSTWYYLWVIYNGSAVAGLLSTSSTAPTLPGGYTYKALVGAVRNDGSSNFVTFYQQDRTVWVNDTNIFTSKAAAGSNTYESYQAGGGGSDVDLRTVIPPTAKRMRGTAGNSTSSNQAIAVAGDASGLGAVTINASQANGAAVNSFSVAGSFIVPLKTAQTFYWKSTDTSARNRVSVSGYEI